MNAVAGLLLLITGEAAPALATIAKVQGGLQGLSGTVASTNFAEGLIGGILGVSRAIGLAGIIAAAAVVGFGLQSAHSLVESGEAAYMMSEKFGIAKHTASEWVAAGTAVGVSAGQVSMAFQFLGRSMETLNLHMQANPQDARKVMESTEALRLSTERYNTAVRQHGADSAQAQGALLSLQRTQDSYNKITGETAAKLGPAAQAFHDLGVNIFDAQGKLRPMTDVMLQVADVFKDMPDGAEKTGLAMRLFGRSGASLIPLLDQGADGIRAYMAQAKALGATLSDQQVDAAHKAFLGQQQLTLAWQGATSQLGAYFLPMLITLVNWFASKGIPAIEHFVGLFRPLGDAVGLFFTKVGNGENVFSALGDVLHKGEDIMVPLGAIWDHLRQAFLDALPQIMRIVKSFGPDADGLGGVIHDLLPVISNLITGGLDLIAPALKLIADNMEILKPILYTIVGYWVLWNAAQKVTQTLGVLTSLPGMIAKLIPSLLGMSGALDVLGISEAAAFWPLLLVVAIIAGLILIGVLLITHWKQISTTVHDLGVLLGTFFVEVWHKVTDAVGGFFSAVGSKVQDWLKDVGNFFSNVGKTIHDTWDGLWKWIGDKVQGGISAVGGLFSALGKTIHDTWDSIVKTVENAARAFWERPFYWITRVVLFIPGQLFQLYRHFIKWRDDTEKTIETWGRNVWRTVSTWLSKLPGEVARWLADLAGRFVKWGSDSLKWAGETAGTLYRNFIDWISKLPGEIGKSLADLWARFLKWGSDTLNWAGQTASNVYSTVVNWISQLPAKLGEFFATIVANVISWSKDMASQAGDMAQQFWNAITNFDWISLGGSIINGIIQGMKNLGGWMARQVGDIAHQIGQAFKDAFGIGSPSRLMAEEVGKPIAQGVAKGIAQNAHLARGALGNLVGSLNKPIVLASNPVAGPAGAAPGAAPGAGGAGANGGSDRDLFVQMLAYLKAMALDMPPLTGQSAVVRVG